MFHVLVVEDEIRICKMIRLLIKWDELNLLSAGEAYDGFSAYKIIQETQPDIVITDIRLPGLNGIELIKKASEMEHSPHFVIISGHKEFEYAHSALKYNVEDYLIKPVNGDELNQTLQRTITKLLAERKSEASVADNAYVLNTGQYQQLLAHSLILDIYHSETWEDLKQNYSWNSQWLTVVIVRLFDNADYAGQNSLATRKTEDALREFFDLCSISSLENDIVCVVPHDLSNKAWQDHLDDLREQLFRQLYPFDLISFMIAVSSATDDPSSLKSAYRQAQYALGSVFIQKKNSIVFSDNLPAEICFLDCLKTPNAQQRLMRIVETQNLSDLDCFINEQILHAKEIRCYQLGLISFFSELFSSLLRYADAISLQTEPLMQQYNQTLRLLQQCSSEQRLITSAKSGMESFLQKLRIQCEQKENSVILTARSYVQKHYQKRITLEDVAGIVFLNPAYFSVLFKKETGMNFLDYITDVRMKNARRLLSTQKLNISEVADMVGYKDPKYFSKQFYKTYGIRPQDYKKLHAKGMISNE